VGGGVVLPGGGGLGGGGPGLGVWWGGFWALVLVGWGPPTPYSTSLSPALVQTFPSFPPAPEFPGGPPISFPLLRRGPLGGFSTIHPLFTLGLFGGGLFTSLACLIDTYLFNTMHYASCLRGMLFLRPFSSFHETSLFNFFLFPQHFLRR